MAGFLERLYRNSDQQGRFLEVRLLPSGAGRVEQHWLNDLGEADKWRGSANVYYGVGLRRERRGTRDAVDQLPAVWVDVDFKDFATPAEAAKNLWEKAPLGCGNWSAIVETGGGYHAYAVLSEPATGKDIDRIENINKGLAMTIGADRNSTDAARILRLPGTKNAKYQPPRDVKLSHVSDFEFGDLADLEPYEEKGLLVVPENKITVPGQVEEIETLMERCPFIRHCVENAKDLPEAYWYAMISNVCGFRGSPSWIHDTSKPYKGYTRTETDAKILHAMDASAPISCDWIKSKGFNCGRKCGVRSPAGLVWKGAPSLIIKKRKNTGDRSSVILRHVEEAIPTTGWLHDFLRYTTPMTDAPKIFHLFSGLSVLSAAAGRGFWMQGWGGAALYPNLWSILIAPSSKYRKSTIIEAARSVMVAAGLMVMPESFSKEQMISELSEKSQVTFIWPEFGDALAQMNKEYMAGTKDLLSHLYDCPATYQRKLRGESFSIKNPYLTILGGVPLDWMADKGLSKDIRGGFFARFIYVPLHRKQWEVRMPPPPDTMLFTTLKNNLTNIIMSGGGRYSFSQVMDESKQFEEELGRLASVSEYSLELTAAYSRLQVTTFKLAMLFALSRGQIGGDVSIDDMRRAISCAKAARYATEEIVRALPMDNDDKIIVAITSKMAHLHHEGSEWVSLRDIIRLTHKPKHKVLDALETMDMMGRIVKTNIGKKVRYKLTVD